MDKKFTHRSVYLHSIGCRTNQEEFHALQAAFQSAGYSIADSVEDAQWALLNTCCVTGTTESKTRRIVRSLSRRAPHVMWIITGCLVQKNPEAFRDFPQVRWIVGNACKDQIVAILTEQEIPETAGLVHSADLDVPPPLAMHSEIRGPQNSFRTRYAVKIQEGCNYQCTYCIVPSVRGPSRSVSAVTILDTVKKAVAAGYKEIILTGTHIGQYHDSAKPRYGLVDLLDDILVISGDFRLRLSSLDPRDISSDLLARISQNDQVCKHLHVSIQHCDPHILRDMDRWYEGFSECCDTLQCFRSHHPSIALCGDFIVGFPGETDHAFESLCRCIEHIGFVDGHVFRYSCRPGTKAAERGGQIPDSLKKERSARVRALLDSQYRRFAESCCDTTQRIIMESTDPVRGVTSNYLKIMVPENEHARKNNWLSVRILSYNSKQRVCTADTDKESP